MSAKCQKQTSVVVSQGITDDFCPVSMDVNVPKPGEVLWNVRDGMDLRQKGSSKSPRLIEVQRLFDGRVKLFSLKNWVELRGTLLALEFSNIPFTPRRTFVVHGVPPGVSRGGHAHERGEQLLIAIAGEIVVDLRYEGMEHRISLTESTQALLIGPCIWARQTYSTPGAILMVHASEAYEEDSYLDEASNLINRR
jgi:hypothetical protein